MLGRLHLTKSLVFEQRGPRLEVAFAELAQRLLIYSNKDRFLAKIEIMRPICQNKIMNNFNIQN